MEENESIYLVYYDQLTISSMVHFPVTSHKYCEKQIQVSTR